MTVNNQMKEKIRIIHILPYLEGGGSERVVFNLIMNLDRSRFEPIIIYFFDDLYGNYRKDYINIGIKVQCINEPRSILSSFIYPKMLIREILRYNPSIIHIHSGCWYKASLAAKFSGVKRVIYTEHGRFEHEPFSLIILDNVASLFTDEVISVSDELKLYFQKFLKIKKSKITTITNGIDIRSLVPMPKNNTILDGLQIDRSSFIVGNIARLSPEKDHITLIKAFYKAKKSVDNLKMFIVGDGPEKDFLKRYISTLELTNDVLLLGFRSDISEILSTFDVFILSSLTEGTSMTILEAMAMEKPVIATNVGGNAKLVQNEINGFLVQPRDEEAIAYRILEFYSDQELGKVMGRRGREMVISNFNVNKMTLRYQELYRKLYDTGKDL